jgi:lysophospholipase L1-like esterase
MPLPVRLALLAFLALGTALHAASFADFDRRAKAGERLTVVFFGASLTWGANATDPGQTSYRAEVARRFEQAYPAAHFRFRDAAIGGTGSQLGVFRLDRDVLRHGPDLVFLDFSANDDIGSADVETLASYEAIVRRLVAEAKLPVVQVIFPFQWNVENGKLEAMPRRTAHLAIAKAYGTAVGDAIALAKERVASGTAIKTLWPYDPVHPGDAGYVLFADAAWQAFTAAVEAKQECAAPAEMLYAPTYRESARVRISSLGTLPAGWRVDHPNLTSAFFDMLMSRWLDDECVAAWGGKDQPAAAAPLKVRFRGAMVMLFGESTMKTGGYRALIDGKPAERHAGGKTLDTFAPGDFSRTCNGNVHQVQVLATGLDPAAEHTLELQPLPGTGEQELRLESICVAGPGARVTAAP